MNALFASGTFYLPESVISTFQQHFKQQWYMLIIHGSTSCCGGNAQIFCTVQYVTTKQNKKLRLPLYVIAETILVIYYISIVIPSVLCRCCLGGRKGIRLVKN